MCAVIGVSSSHGLGVFSAAAEMSSPRDDATNMVQAGLQRCFTSKETIPIKGY